MLTILLGYALGSLVGGILYKEVGGTTTLRIFSILAAFSALTYFILHVTYLRHKTRGNGSILLYEYIKIVNFNLEYIWL